jgi:phenylacetic acid degradation operon negative regulatory protein
MRISSNCFAPLAALTEAQMAQLGGRLCLIARLVLVNEFRHVALSDPDLPDAARPSDWPADAARRLYARLYCRLSGAADSHVAGHFIDAQGKLRDRRRRGCGAHRRALTLLSAP